MRDNALFERVRFKLKPTIEYSGSLPTSNRFYVALSQSIWNHCPFRCTFSLNFIVVIFHTAAEILCLCVPYGIECPLSCVSVRLVHSTLFYTGNSLTHTLTNTRTRWKLYGKIFWLKPSRWYIEPRGLNRICVSSHKVLSTFRRSVALFVVFVVFVPCVCVFGRVFYFLACVQQTDNINNSFSALLREKRQRASVNA